VAKGAPQKIPPLRTNRRLNVDRPDWTGVLKDLTANGWGGGDRMHVVGERKRFPPLKLNEEKRKGFVVLTAKLQFKVPAWGQEPLKRKQRKEGEKEKKENHRKEFGQRNH